MQNVTARLTGGNTTQTNMIQSLQNVYRNTIAPDRKATEARQMTVPLMVVDGLENTPGDR